RLTRLRERGCRRIAERALPEAEVADRNVEVSGQPRELRRVEMLVHDARELLDRVEVPPVEHRDAGADVPEWDGEVDRRVARLRNPAAALGPEPLVVDEADLLRRV